LISVVTAADVPPAPFDALTDRMFFWFDSNVTVTLKRPLAPAVAETGVSPPVTVTTVPTAEVPLT
jgi:hypothetical protein